MGSGNGDVYVNAHSDVYIGSHHRSVECTLFFFEKVSCSFNYLLSAMKGLDLRFLLKPSSPLSLSLAPSRARSADRSNIRAAIRFGVEAGGWINGKPQKR